MPRDAHDGGRGGPRPARGPSRHPPRRRISRPCFQTDGRSRPPSGRAAASFSRAAPARRMRLAREPPAAAAAADCNDSERDLDSAWAIGEPAPGRLSLSRCLPEPTPPVYGVVAPCLDTHVPRVRVPSRRRPQSESLPVAFTESRPLTQAGQPGTGLPVPRWRRRPGPRPARAETLRLSVTSVMVNLNLNAELSHSARHSEPERDSRCQASPAQAVPEIPHSSQTGSSRA